MGWDSQHVSKQVVIRGPSIRVATVDGQLGWPMAVASRPVNVASLQSIHELHLASFHAR